MPKSPLSEASMGLVNTFLVLVIFLGGWMMLRPEYNDLKQVRIEADTVLVELNTKKETIKQINELVSNYDSLREDFLALEKAIPSSPRVPQLLANLEELTIQGGMVINEMDVTEMTEQDLKNTMQATDPAATASTGGLGDKPLLIPIKIDLKVTGSYENFLTFLTSIEKNIRLLDVKILNIEPGEGENATQPTFDFVIETMYQK